MFGISSIDTGRKGVAIGRYYSSSWACFAFMTSGSVVREAMTLQATAQSKGKSRRIGNSSVDASARSDAAIERE
jgi:hypothetical protein